MQRFTRASLTLFDGAAMGRPVLVAYRGFVYDVTESFMWMNGRHFWHRAGRDLSRALKEAPHGEDLLAGMPKIGVLIDAPTEKGQE